MLGNCSHCFNMGVKKPVVLFRMIFKKCPLQGSKYVLQWNLMGYSQRRRQSRERLMSPHGEHCSSGASQLSNVVSMVLSEVAKVKEKAALCFLWKQKHFSQL